jgi:molybdopterin adenylyltransferase
MSLRFAILTVSDRSARGERPDESGPALEQVVTEQGWLVVRREVVPDDLLFLRDRQLWRQ